MELDVFKLDEFTKAYLEAALWSSSDESDEQGGEPLDLNYDFTDIHQDTLAAMAADCAKFQADNAELLIDDNCLTISGDCSMLQRAGHDFWLTRHHHGANFLDGDWKKIVGQLLFDAAQKYPEINLYIGDDGKIHAE